MNSTQLDKIIKDNKIDRVYDYNTNDWSTYYENRVYRYFDYNGILMGIINKEDYICNPINDVIVYINNKGKIIYENEFIGKRYSQFHGGLCCVSNKPELYKVINTNGDYITEDEFKINNNSNSSRAFPRVIKGTGILIVYRLGKYGMLRKDGKILGEGIVYDRIEPPITQDNIFKVILDSSYWHLDINGDRVTENKYCKCSNYTNGIAIVQLGKKFAFINTKGEYINNYKYNKIKSFSKTGYGIGIRGNQLKYVDVNGEEYDTLEIEI